MGPERLVVPGAGSIPGDEPEEEEQANVGPPERVSLEVEEHVARVGFGQKFEAAPPSRILGRLDDLVVRRTLPIRSCTHLEAGLLDQAVQPLTSHAVDRIPPPCQQVHRAHAGPLQRQPVFASDAGDVVERVALPPHVRAGVLELAEVTVGTWFGNGDRATCLLVQQGGQL